MFDSHFHLVQLPNPFETAKELIKNGYCGEICACEPQEWAKQSDLCEQIGQFTKKGCFFEQSYGLHPMFAGQATEADFDLLKTVLLQNPQAAVGECGLDKRFTGYELGGIQEKVLRRHVRLAKELGRRITFHIVGDHHRVFRILKEECLPCNTTLYFHRFGGDASAVALAREYDATFGNPRKIACVPEELTRFETDADINFCEPNTPPQLVAQKLIDTLQKAAQQLH